MSRELLLARQQNNRQRYKVKESSQVRNTNIANNTLFMKDNLMGGGSTSMERIPSQNTTGNITGAIKGLNLQDHQAAVISVPASNSLKGMGSGVSQGQSRMQTANQRKTQQVAM